MQMRVTPPQDDRTLFAAESVRRLLEHNGLAEIDAVFARGETVRCRHPGRAVYETTLAGDDGGPARVFVKLNWGRRRILPRMTDLKTGQVFQSLPVREWRGLGRLASLGLNVPERLALFRDGLVSFRAAIVVRAVPPSHSLDEMLQNGAWGRLAAEERDSLLDAVVAALGTIHAAGLGWRGTTSRHFFPELDESGRWKLWLIDCEGVHGRATRRTVERDYRKLRRAMRESGADGATLELLERKIVHSAVWRD